VVVVQQRWCEVCAEVGQSTVAKVRFQGRPIAGLRSWGAGQGKIKGRGRERGRGGSEERQTWMFESAK